MRKDSEYRKIQYRRLRQARRQAKSKIPYTKYISSVDDGVESSIKHNSFTDFKLDFRILNNLTFKTPTPIQDQAIPAIKAKQDVVGIAPTGSGKTAAFLIPIINRLLNEPKTVILIISPTRELAAQIQQEFGRLANGLNIKSVTLIGGESTQGQVKGLKNLPQVIIGTPGRINYLNELGLLNNKNIKCVVLDEVDRMLDLGFRQQVLFLLNHLNKNIQKLFFSATYTDKTQELVQNYAPNATDVVVARNLIPSTIEREIVPIYDTREKVSELIKLLKKLSGKKILIFCNTKVVTDDLAQKLATANFSVTTLHGNKTQLKRRVSLREFKTGKENILIATDVAARGLDITDIDCVINYDEPPSYRIYIHRIGRTGRAGDTGKAFTFVEDFKARQQTLQLD